MMVRPVYVSPTLTGRTGVTMTYLSFKRWVWIALGDEASEAELRAFYKFRREPLPRSENGDASRSLPRPPSRHTGPGSCCMPTGYWAPWRLRDTWAGDV